MSGLGVASGDGTKALVNRAVPVAVVALALIGIGRLVVHLVVPEPQRLCYQPPCPQPVKPMAGVWTIAVALALALVVGIVVVRRVRPVLAAIAVAVPGLILLVLPVPRLWAILQAVQADPGLILQERRAGVGPLDPLAVVIGLALLGCSVLCHLGGRGLSGRGVESSGLSPRWPEVAWLGTAIAALLLGLVPIVGELAVTYPLLQGQYVWQSWMPDQGTPRSGGARGAALLLLALTGLVVAARLRAARAVWGRPTSSGAGGCPGAARRPAGFRGGGGLATDIPADPHRAVRGRGVARATGPGCRAGRVRCVGSTHQAARLTASRAAAALLRTCPDMKVPEPLMGPGT